ncbi:uncharacterized protein LOC105848973 [Hydra vulgaris]|uniref:uncharacterized protein LOC105848973 n=1 Tax=Hydra vulgaris TaxID=6087 RepID=UPI001F5E9E6B|nr:uncharacterized protein LOC105848973 [Hydra vulgaris]
MTYPDRNRTKKLDFVDTQKLSSTFVLLWYKNCEKDERHTSPISLSNTLFKHYSSVECLEFQVKNVVHVSIANIQHAAVIIYKGSITQCCKFETLLDNFMDDFGDENPSTDEVSKFALNYIEGNTDGKRKHSDGDQSSDSENIAPVSEHTGLNGPKYKSTPKSKVLKKKHVNEVLNENSESESFASFYKSQKGSKKSEAQIMALEKRKLDMLLDNVDAPRALMLPIISDVPKTKHCGSPKLSKLSCLEAILIEQKKLLFEQKKTNKLLSEILRPIEKESVNNDNAVYTGFDAEFKLHDIQKREPCSFARKFILLRFGKEFTCTRICEPNGPTARIHMENEEIQEVKGALDKVFTSYNWRVVRASINQFFRDNKSSTKV